MQTNGKETLYFPPRLWLSSNVCIYGKKQGVKYLKMTGHTVCTKKSLYMLALCVTCTVDTQMYAQRECLCVCWPLISLHPKEPTEGMYSCPSAAQLWTNQAESSPKLLDCQKTFCCLMTIMNFNPGSLTGTRNNLHNLWSQQHQHVLLHDIFWPVCVFVCVLFVSILF